MTLKKDYANSYSSKQRTDVPIRGKFNATITNETRLVETEGFLMKRSLYGPPLL